MRLILSLLPCLCICLVLGGCQGKEEKQEIAKGTKQIEEIEMDFKITSTAFADGASIPSKYTCEGDDVSPGLKWENQPSGAKSFALICDDPDAPMKTWVHWVIWAIPAIATALAEATPTQSTLDDGARQGKNDFGNIGYGGPCPPGGKPHRYFFKLYALDNIPDLEPGSTKKQLLKAIEGHILAETQTMGTYQR